MPPQVECRGEPVECPQVAGLLGSPAFPVAMPAGAPAPGDTLVAVSASQLAYAPSGAPTVASVFGRMGVVLAQLGDYLASLITNDSAVPGVTVADALDALALQPPLAHASTHAPATGSDPLSTAIAGTIAIGDAAAVGVADALARSDHQHALPAPALPMAQTLGAGTAGVAASPARADHVHPLAAQAPAAHASTHAPATGSDPLSTAIAGTIAIGDAAAVGVADALARSDHQHALPAPGAAPPVIAAAGATGVATTPARSDHTHGHGSQAIGAGTDHAAATVALAGFMSAADKAKLDGISTGAGPAFLHWGSNSVSATTTTRYMPPGYDSALASLTAIQYRIPAACKLRNLRVRHNVTAGNGLSIVYTVRKNSVATLLSVSMASTAADGSDLVNVISFAAGDLLDIEVTKAASVGTTPNDVLAVLEVAAP